MNNIVSFETAKRLEKAGFPQPSTVELGDAWYSCRKECFIISEGLKTGISPLSWFSCYPYFAPSATDILLLMPDHTMLCRANNDMFLCWTRKDRLPTTGDGTCMHNPAEACAEAWLKLNEK